MILKKTKKSQQIMNRESQSIDEEEVVAGQSAFASSGNTTQGENHGEQVQEIAQHKSLFTWENVDYTVPYQNGERKLLNKVNGFAKPGELIALMGASGAGKTCLTRYIGSKTANRRCRWRHAC